MLRVLINLFLVFVIAIAASFAAYGFTFGLQWMTSIRDDLLLIGLTESDHLIKILSWFGIGTASIAFIRLAFGVSLYPGPADCIFHVRNPQRRLRTRKGIGSCLTAFVSCCLGLPVGYYGPVILLGATCAQLTINNSRPQLDQRQDWLLLAGIVAAITVGFDTPASAVLFALLVVSQTRGWRLVGVLVGVAALADWINHSVMGTPRESLTLGDMPPWQSLLGIALVTLAGCGLGLTLVRWLKHLQRYRSWINHRAIWVLAALSLCFVLLALVDPSLLGWEHRIADLYAASTYDLLVMISACLFISGICICGGFFGGILGPAMLLGGCGGALVSLAFVGLGAAETISWPLIIAAMAATTVTISGAPLFCAVLVGELYGSLSTALLALVAAYFSLRIYLRFEPKPYYLQQVDDLVEKDLAATAVL